MAGAKEDGEEAAAGRNLCFRALGIALDTAVEEGGLWYASTKNLEVSCVELCLICRACWKYTSGPVLVTADTPRHLWLRFNKPAEEEAAKNQHNKKTLLDARPRVPSLVVRALKVLDFPESIQARLSDGARSSPRFIQQAGGLVRAYRRWQHWFRRQGPLWWPDTLVEITFGGAEFNRTIAGIVWPASLRELTLGGGFNQPVLGAVWPALLQRLSFGDNFDQPIAGAVWPSGLQQLSFGCLFNKPIVEVTWPASLQRLSFRNSATLFLTDDDRFDPPNVIDFFGCEACRLHDMMGAKFNQDIVHVVWPVSLREMSFGDYFNQSLVGVSWPDSLQQLSFGRCFNQPIAGVVWPASLRQLSFRNDSIFFAGVAGDSDQCLFHGHFCVTSAQQNRRGSKFNQPIDGAVAWPASLQRLSFGYSFNKPIARVVWPVCVQQLSFGHSFNQPIVGAVWPASLRGLTLGGEFNQPVLGAVWPASLRRLSFGDNFDQPVAGAVLPSGLQQLSFGCFFNQPIDGVAWPASLQRLSFGHSFNQPIDGEVAWPASLKRLSFGKDFNQPVAGVLWAASLQHLSFGDDFNRPLAGAVWPDSLQTLSVGKSFIQPVAGIVWPPSLRLRRVWGDPPRIFGR